MALRAGLLRLRAAGDAVIYTGTIWGNISDGKSDATEEEVSAAAKHANAYDFIMQLPNGFHTEIGERGSQLSGG
ncbi:hypothetical protein [Paenibacillus sp. OSY-SE]|uniref:hypothetical protein n=1 Tax=Paenibacillus sp. OSY-SE TaxID=1196323 RepID=UPI0002E24A2A|nr:hypothetical protein [Paenibacillus sp. OSY-SE]